MLVINEDVLYIKTRLAGLGFNPELINFYNESHRFFHTIDHVIDILKRFSVEQLKDDSLFLAAVFHDIYYKPFTSFCNEDESANLFIREAINSNISNTTKEEVKQIILDTKDGNASIVKSGIFQYLDRIILMSEDINKLIQYENDIFKEFQCYDYKKYKQGRLDFLKDYNTDAIGKLKVYIQYRQPKIGLYCGSFSPFHIGHLNILEKSEQIFDKVILARGKNPDKLNNKIYELPESLKNRQIEEYDGLLTDFIDSLGYDVTLIRGLRNSNDLEFEKNQYRYLKDLKPNINVVSIFCDPEFEHISSSSIRMLEKYNKHEQYLVK